ncbi:MAG: pyruvate, phosphate dikinase [Spirochaetaceae bacterium]|nr:pyruvate, phosphate dikinase [Spirochaetaceae bacterium]MCF7948190.1 pyruvate, phosphate dikinase [Spirochaetia bacterium]MCF7950806.1 pyruvate, phosphate dikinase [Spirochaetaceae bacterium]
MNKAVHFFSRNKYVKDTDTWDLFGIRGKQAMEFAALDLPIVPGFILDSRIAAHLDNFKLAAELPEVITLFEQETGKKFNDPKNPLLLKVVISPNLAIVHYPTLHNFGLTDETLPGFTDYVGEEFSYHEILFLIHGLFQVEHKIAEIQEDKKNIQLYSNKISSLDSVLHNETASTKLKKTLEDMRAYLPDDFFSNAYAQLEYCLRRISILLSMDELDNEDAALIVQPMVYGNYGSDSGSGEYATRNPVTGQSKIFGWYVPDTFNSEERKGQDVTGLSPKYVKELEKTAKTVEDHFMEIRSIRFTIENKKLWFVDQRPLVTKSTQADIQLLLDLHRRKKITDNYLIHAIKPDQLNEILHPVIHPESVKEFKDISGGIAGAPGAAIGRVYFTTDSLLDAYRNAQQQGEDTRMILCMPATFADDVKAIEVASGVLSSEGGYSAHASVVARQYGKVSLVHKDLKFTNKSAKIGQHTLKEGDLITLQVPHYGEPHIYLGQAQLIEPDPKDSGLLDFVQLIKKHVKDFHVRVNADTGRDSQLAVTFGAEGIGLCRTEHMFFKEERINVFREMILSENETDRRKVLNKLKKMQKDDFYSIFKAMDGKEVTIRLLDAPLHEFLPHNKAQTKAFVNYMHTEAGNTKITEKQVSDISESLQEFNPMLGHRGCRIAVSYPEIYEMQVEAVFEAAFKARKDGVKVSPEIMIPLIMNSDELKLIIFGKKIEGKNYRGLSDIEEEVRKKLKEKSKMEHHFGTMIELPVAALAAGDIARYADFFSFGTNDLTQTTIGLSRDDYTSFMPDYTLFDIIPGNPFKELDPYVRELISTAVRRGKMTRPGLSTGLCGEHGAIPQNIRFCIDAGLDYVSCSVYSVPIALLAVAQEVVPETKE